MTVDLGCDMRHSGPSPTPHYAKAEPNKNHTGSHFITNLISREQNNIFKKYLLKSIPTL